MGKQIEIIATKNEVLDIIETAKQRFPELYIYIWKETYVGDPFCFWDVYLKSLSIDDSEVNRYLDDRYFTSINLSSSSEKMEDGCYTYGRIYIRTSGLKYVGEELVPEEQSGEIMTIYIT